MLHIEALVEDKSGGVIVEAFLKTLMQDAGSPVPLRYAVHPHRGCGALPRDWRHHPDVKDQSLLALLPAKLRAYRRVFHGGAPLLVLVVMDSDDHDPKGLFQTLQAVRRTMAVDLPVVIGLATEELEAWMLGDPEAIVAAYPDADRSVLDAYRQDSVCGTWEVLCRALMGEQAEDLIEMGYPAVGKYKYQWAANIAPHLDPSRNRSPSFRHFYDYLSRGLAQGRWPVHGAALPRKDHRRG